MAMCNATYGKCYKYVSFFILFYACDHNILNIRLNVCATYEWESKQGRMKKEGRSRDPP